MIRSRYLNSAIVVFLAVLDIANAKLPSTIKTCSRTDPNINQCIKEAVNTVRPLLGSGDLGDGFHTPPLEPLLLDNIEMSRGREFKATFSEIQALGGSNFQIEKLESNISAVAFDVNVFLPRIDFSGKYSLRIKILLLEINGDGNMKGTFTNARASVQMRGVRVNRDGTEYVQFEKMPIKIHVNNINIKLENLFGGDPILGEAGNAIINDNQDLYLSEIIPGLEKGLSKKFLAIANNILATATYDEMFPPN